MATPHPSISHSTWLARSSLLVRSELALVLYSNSIFYLLGDGNISRASQEFVRHAIFN